MPRFPALVICTVFAAYPALAQDIAGEWTTPPTAVRLFNRTSGPTSTVTFALTFTKDRQNKLAGNLVISGRAPDMLSTFSCTAISYADSKLSFRFEDTPGTGQGGSFTGTVSTDGILIAGFIESAAYREQVQFHRTGRTPASTASATAVSAPAATTATADSTDLLSRALAKLAGTDLRLQKYIGLETIERRYFSPSASATRSDVMTEAPCIGRTLGNNGHLQLTAEDHLRLQVAVGENGEEIDSWASASSFDSRSIADLVPGGTKIRGIFGTSLVGIFQNPGVRFAFQSYKIEAGRNLATYSFEVPQEASKYQVHTADGWQTTAYRGTFDIDSSTAELTHLVDETVGVPQGADACFYRNSTNYHYQPIGGGQYLIPSDSSFDVLLPTGEEDHGVIEFSGWREYSADSSVTFGVDAPATARQTASKTPPPLPAGLPLTLALVNPIDSRTAAGGDVITAKVSEAVRAPGSRETLIAKGAIVRGHILQARAEFLTGRLQIGIHYNTIEQNGTIAQLAVRLDSALKADQAKKGELSIRGTEFGLAPQKAEPGTWFTVPYQGGQATLNAGYETRWVTVAQ